jgi:hypothetical protein
MRFASKRLGAVGALGALVVAVFLAPAVVADTSRAPERPATLEAFQSFSSFAAAGRLGQTISFDDLETGVSLDNPASFGVVTISHSTATTFKTIGSPVYLPTSLPNVLAPFQPDNTLVLGDTTLAFAKNHRAAGLFLVLAEGSNQDAVWMSTVTATDTKAQSLTLTVTFRGVVGQQQFVGFRSQHKLAAITFGPAFRIGFSSVLAIDDVVVD